MTRIYRVENAGGWGIYCGAAGSPYMKVWPKRGSTATKRQPGPWQDAKLRAEPYFIANVRNTWIGCPYYLLDTLRFGFASKERLLHWFSLTARRKFKKLGFRVGVYEVAPEHCAIGDTQAVFDKAHATHLCDLDLVELIDPAQPELQLAA